MSSISETDFCKQRLGEEGMGEGVMVTCPLSAKFNLHFPHRPVKATSGKKLSGGQSRCVMNFKDKIVTHHCLSITSNSEGMKFLSYLEHREGFICSLYDDDMLRTLHVLLH